MLKPFSTVALHLKLGNAYLLNKKMQAELVFSSRRSPVICLNGCVASSQPLASNIGLGEKTE